MRDELKVVKPFQFWRTYLSEKFSVQLFLEDIFHSACVKKAVLLLWKWLLKNYLG